MSSEAVEAAIAAARPKGNGADRPASPLRVIDPRAWHGVPIPERRWLVPEWVPRGVVTGLYGPPGTGKSLLALQLMTSTALGKPWLGMPVEPVRSVGVFCEDDDDELHRRQNAINRELYRCDFADLGDMRLLPRLGEDNILMTFGSDGRGAPTPFFSQLAEMAQAERANLVVIDTIADTFGGNQNDAGQVRQFVQFGLGRLARMIGGAVMACAHPSRAGQNAGTGESGSVQWDATFRSRLYMSAPPKGEDDEIIDPDARVLTRKKANYAARDDVIELRWRDGVFSTGGGVGLGDDRPDAATVFLAQLAKMTEEGQSLSHNHRAGNYAPRVFLDRREHWGYRQKDFERAMQSLFERGEIRVEGYGPPSKRMQRIVRDISPDF
jgi:RecA-family ATPase